MQDVPGYAQRAGLRFRDYLDERLPARLDTDHMVRLNYETYFFGDLWSRARFEADAWRFCGLLTDPVSRERFRPNAQSPRASHEKVSYFFESAANQALFKADPEAYLLPGWKM